MPWQLESGSLAHRASLDDALAELEKPRGSKVKVKSILETLRLHLNP